MSKVLFSDNPGLQKVKIKPESVRRKIQEFNQPQNIQYHSVHCWEEKKKSMDKYTLAVQTCVVQGSAV